MNEIDPPPTTEDEAAAADTVLPFFLIPEMLAEVKAFFRVPTVIAKSLSKLMHPSRPPSSNPNLVSGFFSNLFRRVTFSQGANQGAGAVGSGGRKSRQSTAAGGGSDRSVSPAASESSFVTDNDYRYRKWLVYPLESNISNLTPYLYLKTAALASNAEEPTAMMHLMQRFLRSSIIYMEESVEAADQSLI